MEQKSNAFLETQPIGRLMAKYAVPCVISLLVAALYNIVDQIFIANADYLGSYGSAAVPGKALRELTENQPCGVFPPPSAF